MHTEVKRVTVHEAALPGVQISAPDPNEDHAAVESSDSNAQTGKKRVRAKG